MVSVWLLIYQPPPSVCNQLPPNGTPSTGLSSSMAPKGWSLLHLCNALPHVFYPSAAAVREGSCPLLPSRQLWDCLSATTHGDQQWDPET